MKKGSKGDIKKLIDLLSNIDLSDFDLQNRLFIDLLGYFSKISNEYILNNQDDFDLICQQFFSNPNLFSILDNLYIRPALLHGFSIFVWHSNISIFSKASAFYPKLYQLFCNGNSEQREKVVIIALAIEKATKISFVEYTEMSNSHRNTILNLMKQYKIV